MTGRSLTASQLSELANLVNNPVAYYVKLASFGDAYGSLALEVVTDTPASGSTARAYAESVAAEHGHTITTADWVSISTELALADLAARRVAFNNGTPSLDLPVSAIRSYHVSVFAAHGLPPEAWTAYIPLELVGVDKEDELWETMKQVGFGTELLNGSSVLLTVIQSFASSHIGDILNGANQGLSALLATALVDIETKNEPADIWLRNLLLTRTWIASLGAGNDITPYQTDLVGGGKLIGGRGVSAIEYPLILLGYASSPDDNITGTEFDDQILGYSGDDRLDGGAGNDTISGGLGDDTLIGGAGNDLLIGGEQGLSGFFGAGIDTADYSGVHSGITVTLGTDPLVNIPAIEVTNDGQGGRDILIGIEKIVGTSSSDTIIVNDINQSQMDNEIFSTNRFQGIDFGSANIAQDVDMIDASNMKYGIYADLSDKDNQIVRKNGFGLGIAASLGLIPALYTKNANSVTGSKYDDTLIGEDGKIGSGEGYSTLHGGAGNDTLVGAGWESHLYGGSGADTFEVGSNTWIEDGEIGAGDTVSYGGIRLYGGSKQWWMQGSHAYWAPFSTLLTAFPVIGSELIYTASFFIDALTMKFATYQLDDDGTLEVNFGYGLGGSAAIKNYSLDMDSGVGTAGITVFSTGSGRDKNFNQQHFNQFINLALNAGFGHGLPGHDPIVLDLNGDGYNLTTEDNSGVYFEFDQDGFAEHTGWLRATDGFLVHDANANGKIDDVSEMFGNDSTGGFDELSAYDSNHDGVVDASDAQFASLQVWQDLNQDGITDTGELKSLTDLGIFSLSLTNAAPSQSTEVGGNVIASEGLFTRSDGTTGKVGEVVLAVNQANSKWTGDNTVNATAAALPELKGSGELRDLRVAMTSDATLLQDVQTFTVSTSHDPSVLKASAIIVLFQWAGVENVTATALGSDGFDTQKLAFLEKYSGYELMPRDASGNIQLTNLTQMEAMWDDQITRLTLRLAVQGPLASVFSSVTYMTNLDLLVANGPNTLADILHQLLVDLPSDPTAAAAQWHEWGAMVGAVADGMVRFDNNVVEKEFLFEQLVRAADGVAQPLALTALATDLGITNLTVGSSGADTLVRSTVGTAIYYGQGGNDSITGGGGQDIYIFGHNIGHTVITDIEANPAGDRIRFAFLNQSDLDFVRDGNDLLITVKATSETVRVVGQFAPVIPFSNDILLSTDKGVEEIQFANGGVMEIPDIMIAVGKGTDGDDHLVGTMHSDVLQGGKGNDLLEGGDDADLYVFNRGDGNDTINDVQTTVLLRSADELIWGDDIAPGDLVYSRSGDNGQNLIVTVAGSGGSVVINNQFDYTSLGYNAPLAPNSRIELFGFRGYGDALSYKDIQQKLIDQATTSGNDITRGFGDDDIFQASAGNDTLIGMDGADTYNWGRGAGNDTIDEQARFIDLDVGLGGISFTVKADIVQFSADINPADLVFSRPTSAPDLQITILSTGETLTVKNQFAGFQTGAFGAEWMDRIEWFAFSDGSAYSWQDVEAMVTTGGDGNDHLYGDVLADTMKGGKGDDVLSGGGGGDTYLFNLGDGHDTINDNDSSFLGDGWLNTDSGSDILQFGAGISADDISFERNGSSVDLVIGTSGDRVTLYNQDTYIYTGVFGNLSSTRIEEIRFADGTTWTWADLNHRLIAAATTSGNDVTLGTSTDDVFAASAGDDILDGGDGSDTYAFGRGSGHDIIRDHVDNVMDGEDDRLNFGPGISLSDLNFARDGDDLVITIKDSADSLRIEKQFQWDNWFTWHDVESFNFEDGSTLSKEDIQEILLRSTSGNDNIVGFSSDDTLDGGAGDDILTGADGSDTYIFGRGYGHDTIIESVSNANLGDEDVLKFSPDITRNDVTFIRDGNDLVVTITDTGDTMRIKDQFLGSAWYEWHDIETFSFSDGTVLTNADIKELCLVGTPSDDHLIGFITPDTLDGGAGNDILEGGDGNDTYIFGRGYGHDIIRESVGYILNGEDDTLQFGPGISLTDLDFSLSGKTLTITIHDTGDTVEIDGEFTSQAGYSFTDIENFKFADGSVVTKAEIGALALHGTAGDDHIVGFSSDDVLDGGTGDDILEGEDGNDTYVFGRGYGHDTIRESVGYVLIGENDTLQFTGNITASDVSFGRDGADLVVTVNDTGDTVRIEGQFDYLGGGWRDIENFVFSDGTSLSKTDVQQLFLTGTAGNDTINGFGSDDRIIGGAGDDLIFEGEGDDTYVWNLGDGNDIIRGSNGWDGFNTVEFGPGIAVSDLRVARSSSGDGVLLTVAGQPGSILLEDEFKDSIDTGIDQLRFADGTIIGHAALIAMVVATLETSGGDIIQMPGIGGTVDARDGNDTIYGSGTDDRIIGGAGDDVIFEGGGNDTYVWNLGDGHDTILNSGWWDGYNTVEFGVGISQGDISAQFIGNAANDVTISLLGQDILTIDQERINDYGIDKFVFVDGSILDRNAIISIALANFSFSHTDGDDVIVGTEYADIIDGGAGTDTLTGNGGDDSLSGDTGNDTLYGGGGNDTLEGGAGNDMLYGNAGDDTYIFNLGNGQDVISEYDSNGGGFDTLQFGAGIAPGDLTFAQTDNGQDLVIKVAGTTDQITLDNTNTGNPNYEIDQVVFTDGTVWTWQDLLGRATGATPGDDVISGDNNGNYLFGGAGNDILTGNGGNDTLEGGTGNDTLYGNGGDDTYIFNLGDGQDVISEYDSNGGGFDTLQFGAGINPSDITVSQADNGQDLILKIAGTTDQVTLDNTNTGNSNYHIEQVRFNNGTVWSFADLLQYATTATSGNDVFWGDETGNILSGGAGDDILTGNGGNDTLEGGTGNDALYGNGGDDTYIFNLGDGQDVISEYDSNGGGFDTLQFGAGIAPSDLTFAQTDNGQDIIIKIAGTTDQVTLDNTNTGNSNYHVDQIRFNDGTIWSFAQLLQHATAATSGNDIFWGDETGNILSGGAGNDILTGNAGNDTLEGGTGNDMLYGNAGDDTYIFNLGDGQDVISEYDSNGGGFDTLQFGAGIDPTGVTVTQADSGQDLILKINGTTDQVTLDNTNTGNPLYRVDQVRFSDGTIWSFADLIAMSTPTIPSNTIYGTSGNDSIGGTDLNDTIIGGLGDDYMEGRNGSDTYVYASGDGNDHDNDYGTTAGEIDILQLTDINPSDVTLSRDGNDAYVRINATGQSIRIDNEFYNNGNSGYGIERIQFANGTTWNWSQIQQASWYRGSSGNDSIGGSDLNDTFKTGLGDDYVEGRNGSDTYVYASGDGNDRFNDYGTTTGEIDTLQFVDINPSDVTLRRDGNDAYVTINATGQSIRIDNEFANNGNSGYGIERIQFADGTTWNWSQIQQASWYRGSSGNDGIGGSDLDDTIQGGLGDDYMEGRNGSDTYVYASGDGNDRDNDYGTTAGEIDTLKLTDIDVSDVTLRREGNDAYVMITATGQSIRIDNEFAYNGTAGYGIERIQFADGTTWNWSQIQQASWYRGTNGNDSIGGSDLNDTFKTGLGDDYFEGGNGSDTYIYASGDGNDRINDRGTTAGEIDTLKFVDVNASDVTLRRDGVDTYVTINATGQSIRIDNEFYDNGNQGYGIERIQFADGTTWNWSQVQQASWYRGSSGNDGISGSSLGETLAGYAGDDTLFGGDGNDVLIGGSGNDTQWGGGGDDTYVFNLGDGQDTVSEYGNGGAGFDTVQLGANIAPDMLDVTSGNSGNDLILKIAGTTDQIVLQNTNNVSTDYQIDQVRFADGTIWSHDELLARTLGQTLSGTSSDDTITATTGIDTFAFSGNFGNDVIEGFTASGAGHDYIAVDRNQFADWAHLLGATTQVGSDLKITLDSTDSIVIKNMTLASFTPTIAKFM